MALLNTLGKILEAIVASRLSWALESHGLLSKIYIEDRKMFSVDNAM